jgi:ferredoxin, 2Fe-2S
MNIRLRVVDRDGAEHVLDAPSQGTLMEVLRELEYGVTALCGGLCSCASCHVYVVPGREGKIPAAQSDERELVSELRFSREDSRLSCRIELREALDDLCVTLAPEE